MKKFLTVIELNITAYSENFLEISEKEPCFWPILMLILFIMHGDYKSTNRKGPFHNRCRFGGLLECVPTHYR